MNLSHNIQTLREQLLLIEKEAARPEGSVRLLAVSKTMPAAAIREAYAAGIRDFAENYVQEALQKMQNLEDLDIQWHFIGPIQSNKCKEIAKHFHWVHSLSREKIAELLQAERPADLPPLQVCLQINLDEEKSKSGLRVDEALPFAQQLRPFDHLKLRGLMAIPKPETELTKQYQSFLRLKQLLAQINTELALSLDTLSMGMTEDWPAAVKAGSTMIRIGRAIFGERQ